MTGSVTYFGRTRANKQLSQPALLNQLLMSHPCTVGDLVKFARGVPVDWVLPTAIALGESVQSEATADLLRRRQLVILATLVSRLAFEVEDIPRDPDATI